MRRWQRSAVWAAALLSTTGMAAGCELLLSEHRSGRALARLPLRADAPAAQVDFTHSVLGTPVSDHYAWRQSAEGWRAHLVEERFEGEGYGLPHSAAPGQRLQRLGPGWRLSLDRVVHPLVLLPVQGMRVRVAGLPTLGLRGLSTRSIELRAVGCPTP